MDPDHPEGPVSPTTYNRTVSRRRGRQGGYPTSPVMSDPPAGPDGPDDAGGHGHHPSLSFAQMNEADAAYEIHHQEQPYAPAWGAQASRENWGQICKTIHRPLKTYWNLWPTILLFLYAATTGWYIYTRATKTIPEGALGLKIFAWFVLGVECIGVTSMFPYCLLLTISQKPKKTAKGLPAAGTVPDDDYYRFVLRILVPCYKEDDQVIIDTVNGALQADLPPGTQRFVYLCDDGGEQSKKDYMASMGSEAVYVTGRKKIKGDINGKSSNLNNCLRNVIYDKYKRTVDGVEKVQWDLIPLNELIIIFDADMVPGKDFFLRMCEVMTNPDYALCLSPQSFHNIAAETDLFNNLNLQFWEYWLPGAVAWGYIACTGTNFCIRASPLAHCDFFPSYTITEDYALGMELKKKGYTGSYLMAYIAKGEAPTEVRNVMRQRSRWCKGHMQVFFSWASSPLTQWRLSLPMKLWYSYGTWTYLVNIVTTPTFLLIPFMSLAFGINCVILNKSFAAAATFYYASIFLIQNYVNKLAHIKSMWFASISNIVLWFTYTKAVINVLLSVVDLKGGVAFKVTQKAVVANPVKAIVRAVSKVARTMSQRFSTRHHGYDRSVSMADRGQYSGPLEYSGELEGGNVHVQRPPNQKNQPVQVTVVVNSGPKQQEVAPLIEKDETPKVSVFKRIKGVFALRNVDDMGGVLDPVALVIMLMFSLSVIGLGIWRLATDGPSATVGVPSGLPSPYLSIPMLWAVSNAIAPYLFIHYCFTSGGSFKSMAACCRLLGTVATLTAVGLLWASLPLPLDTASAFMKSARFMSSQARLAANVKDMAMVGGAAKDMSGGIFIGSDPVKYVMPLASSVAMLSWSMVDFPGGYTDPAIKRDTIDTITQGAAYLMKSYLPDGNGGQFIAQVGDPTPYIVTPVDPDAPGRIWAPPKQDPNLATPRPAYVIDRNNLGVDVLGSTAAALAAAYMALTANGGDPALTGQMIDYARRIYQLARIGNPTSMKSYCDAGVPCVVNATWTANVPALVLHPGQVRTDGIYCWAADETDKACYWQKTVQDCENAAKSKRIFAIRNSCCSYLNSKGVYNGSVTAQGYCALPEGQSTCFIPEPIRRTCIKNDIAPDTGKGCTGTGLEIFATSFECCNYLKAYGKITAENPGSGVCGAGLETCYVLDSVNRDCVARTGDQCATFGLDTLWDELLPCCNRLIANTVVQLTGNCKAKVPEVSYTPPAPTTTTTTTTPTTTTPKEATPVTGPKTRRRLLQSPPDVSSPIPFAPFITFDPNNPNERTSYPKLIQGDFEFYKSQSIYDDMAWGATWLYRATNDDSYAGDVEKFLSMHDELEANPKLKANETYYAFNWDNPVWGVAAIMAKLTDAEAYHLRIRTFLKTWLQFKAPDRPPELVMQLRSKGQAFRADLLGLEVIQHDDVNNRDLLMLDHCIPDRNTTAAAARLAIKAMNDTSNVGIHFDDPLAVVFEENCSDGKDNDCDGLIDTDDPDCPFFPARVTKLGLAWSKGPNLAHTAASSFLGVYYASYAEASKLYSITILEKLKLRCTGQGQMSYILGRNNRQMSYIVGNGKLSPSRIQHRDSSCGSDHCDFRNAYFPNRPNPHPEFVTGSLVYGPDFNDQFTDERTDPDTQIGLDYNAYFSALAAALLHTKTNEDACGQYNGAFQSLFLDSEL